MPLDDTTLRPVPDLEIFPDEDVRSEVLSKISDEIGERGGGDDDPGAFALLAATRRALAQLRDADDQADGGQTHALLLFHAWHLGTKDGSRYLASTAVCRWAVESDGAAPGGGEGVPPQGPEASPARSGAGGDGPPAGLGSSAYVQLPRHLFWVRESDDDRPRSLDGFFWTRIEGTLHLLGVVDPQSTEGGVEVLPLPGVPLEDRGVWISETMRETGDDFESSIPGAELEGMYELRTAGELLKLAARLDRYVTRFPGSARVGRSHSAGGDPDSGGDGPGSGGDGPGSADDSREGPDYRRITLAQDG